MKSALSDFILGKKGIYGILHIAETPVPLSDSELFNAFLP